MNSLLNTDQTFIVHRNLCFGADDKGGNSLVDIARGKPINGSMMYHISKTDSGRLFTGCTVDDGINSDLYWVLIGHNMDLGLVSIYQMG